MAHPHHPDPNHIFMLQGTSYDPPAIALDYESLKEQSDRKDQELQRLRSLLAANDIPWQLEEDPTQPQTASRTLRRRIAGRVVKTPPKTLPTLPREVQFMIMEYALTSSTPIIDPFFKLRKDNVTHKERVASGRDIMIGFLGACKALNEEGTRLIIKNNDFIFTQVAALQNFAKIPLVSRTSIAHITIRVVGRYYDDVAGDRDLDTFYQHYARKLKVKVLPRPNGMVEGRGLEAYCWTQLEDFFKALVVPRQISDPTVYLKLFPSLKSMRVDLVNWSRHTPPPCSRLLDVMRVKIGGIVDELMMTGNYENEWDATSPKGLLAPLLRDEGLLISGTSEFISTNSGLKPLPGLGRSLSVCCDKANVSAKVAAATTAHPEGGFPPKSRYRPGRTIWKWVSGYYGRPKEWFELHGKSGVDMNLDRELIECGELEHDGTILDE